MPTHGDLTPLTPRSVDALIAKVTTRRSWFLFCAWVGGCLGLLIPKVWDWNDYTKFEVRAVVLLTLLFVGAHYLSIHLTRNLAAKRMHSLRCVGCDYPLSTSRETTTPVTPNDHAHAIEHKTALTPITRVVCSECGLEYAFRPHSPSTDPTDNPTKPATTETT